MISFGFFFKRARQRIVPTALVNVYLNCSHKHRREKKLQLGYPVLKNVYQLVYQSSILCYLPKLLLDSSRVAKLTAVNL